MRTRSPRTPPAKRERVPDGAQACVRDQRILAPVRRARPPASTGVHLHDRDGAADRRAARPDRLGRGAGIEDARNLIHYYRLTPDKRIVIGGGPVGIPPGGALDRDRDENAWRHLEHHLHWLWPHLADVAITHRWGGPFSVTLDLTPALGYIGDDRTAVYGLGCIGHGVSMSYLNGEVLAELLLPDGQGLAAECPFVNRHVIPWPAEPLASAAKYAIRAYLQAEDAYHEKILTRIKHGSNRCDRSLLGLVDFANPAPHQALSARRCSRLVYGRIVHDPPLTQRSATALARAIREGEVSSREVVEAHIEMCERLPAAHRRDRRRAFRRRATRG